MDIDYLVRECPYEQRRQQTHIAGEKDQFNPEFLELSYALGVMLIAYPAASFDDNVISSTFLLLFQTIRALLIAYHHRHIGARYLAAINGVNQSFHIRPAT